MSSKHSGLVDHSTISISTLADRLPAGAGLIITSGDGVSERPSGVPITAGAATWDILDPAMEDPQLLSGYGDDRYDVLYAEDVLQTLPRLSVALANWTRVVRPGGAMVLTVPQGCDGKAASWRFTMQDPAVADGSVNLLELLRVICHLAEVEYVALMPGTPDSRAASANGSDPERMPKDAPEGFHRRIEVLLRKRPHPLTPVQSNDAPEIQMLVKLTEAAIAARAQWQTMEEFEAILASGVRDATVVDLSRLYLLYQWLLTTLRLPGDCIEIGSFRGGTAKLISETLLRRQAGGELHLFDTFAGMPDRLSLDEAGLKGCFADTSVAEVRRLLANNPHVHLHPGIFPDTIPPGLHDHCFRFAHIDVDIESSVHDCLAFVYPRLLPGGVMVIDDYGHAECPGATRAAERFFADRPETIVQMPLVSSAVVIKSA
ncbi:TylF/MycF/NovP-related O-methyltransferase [Rhodospirillaceae bacterium SYSU D60014]|uniref:TylF/MycF/NovP-related O-methyltransferase n=1 Tax=Virgifigura deserti TaxID=2268457 RepID=UPI0013C3F7A1